MLECGVALADPVWAVQTAEQLIEPVFRLLLEVPFQKRREAGDWLRGVLRRKRERFWEAMEAIRGA